MNPNRRIAASAAFAALAFGASLAVPTALAGAHEGNHDEPVPVPAPAPVQKLTGAQRQVIREATRELRDPQAAEAAGYLPAEACAELPVVGGMGPHWINPPLLDDGGRIDPTDEDRPTMLGHLEGPMPGHETDMPVHCDLHAWVFSNNPSGELATWNPRVSCGEAVR